MDDILPIEWYIFQGPDYNMHTNTVKQIDADRDASWKM